MFVFGICIESAERFDRVCLPAIARYGGDDAVLMSSPDLPVAKTYNDVLEASLDLEGVEAIVLLRDDVEIVDPHFRSRVLAAFERDPRLAVIGTGGAGVQPRWWQTGSRETPRAGESGGFAAEYVDGACLVLRPDVAARLRFDDVTFTGDVGFEVDLCHRVRAEGFGVSVEPLDVVRHCDPEDVDDPYRQAAAVWQGRTARSVSLGALERRVALEEGTHLRPGRFGSVAEPTQGVRGSVHDRQVLDAVPREAGRILQLGCGSGSFGRLAAAERGAVVTGLDAAGPHLDEARGHLHEVVEVDLNRLDVTFPRGHFDAVVAVDVLDRLADPEATLARVLPSLSPDGVVVATFPNVKHWSVMLPLLLHDRFEYRDAGVLHRGSVHLFTLVEALTMFRRLGLSRVEPCGSEVVPLHDPAHLDALVSCVASYGTDAEEARTMLETFTYTLSARRA